MDQQKERTLRLKYSGRYIVGFIACRPNQLHSSDMFSTDLFQVASNFLSMGFRVYDQVCSVQIFTQEELLHHHKFTARRLRP